MDKIAEWPWSSEEEAEWKADLEDRNYDFLEELIENALKDGTTSSRDVFPPSQKEQSAEDGTPEKYSVTV